MNFEVLTLFPDMMNAVFGESIIGRAVAAGKYRFTAPIYAHIPRTNTVAWTILRMAGDSVWSCSASRQSTAYAM